MPSGIYTRKMARRLSAHVPSITCQFNHRMQCLDKKRWVFWCYHPSCRIVYVGRENNHRRYICEADSQAYRDGAMTLDELLEQYPQKKVFM